MLGFSVEIIIPHNRGFIFGGEMCTLYIWEKVENDHKTPFKHDRKALISLIIIIFLNSIQNFRFQIEMHNVKEELILYY